MGDIADQINEDGMDIYFDHLHGHIFYDGPCPYCEDDDD